MRVRSKTLKYYLLKIQHRFICIWKKPKATHLTDFWVLAIMKTTNKIEFDGYLNLNLVNNLNYGESFSLIYKSDENEQRTFNVNTNLPYILNSPIGVNLNLNIFRKDSTFTIVNQTAKIYYTLNRKNKIFGGVDLTNSENLLNQTSSSSNVNDYNSTFYTASFEHLNRISEFIIPYKILFLFGRRIGKQRI